MESSDTFNLIGRNAYESRQTLDLAHMEDYHIELRRSSETLREAPTFFDIDPGVEDPDYERQTRFEKFAKVRLSAEFAVVLHEGRSLTGGSFVADREGRLLSDSFRAYGMLARFGFDEFETRRFRLNADAGKTLRINGFCVPIGAQTNRNYFHWLLESLPRLLLAHKLTSVPITLLVPEMTPWMAAMLDVFGRSTDTIVTRSDGATTCSQLLFAARGLSNINTFSHHGMELIEFLIEKTSHLSPLIQNKRLFVSRAHANNRKLSNEAALINVAERHGFFVVFPENYSFMQQISMFRAADIVTGALGAGLTNVAFMRKGGALLELAPSRRDGDATLFANLCSLRGLRYGCIVGSQSIDVAGPAHLGDFTVPESMFEAALIAMR